MSREKILIEGGRVLTPDGFRESSILFDRSIIRCDGEAADARENRDVRHVDASGRLVLPGLIDLHVQGAGGHDFLDEDEGAAGHIAKHLASHGTTSFLATTVVDTRREKQPHLSRIVALASGSDAGANVLGIHLEGPFINPEKRGMIAEKYIEAPGLPRLESIEEICSGHLAMMTVAPEMHGVLDIAVRLQDRGTIPALGHTNATLEEAQRGIEAGITHVTHVTNAMRSFHHREPGALGAVLMGNGLSMQIIPDGVHIHPRVVEWLMKLKGTQSFALITDGIRALGLSPGTYETAGEEFVVEENGSAHHPDGRLIGTAMPQSSLVARLVKIADIPLADAVWMASLYPARILGVADKKGSLEPGKDADIIICEPDTLQPDRVFIGGREVSGIR